MIRELIAHAGTVLGKTALFVLTVSFACAAQAQEDAPAVQPPADATAMVAFLLIFIGMIVAYILWIRYQQKKRSKEQITQPDKA